MSVTSAQTGNTSDGRERRQCVRQHVKSLAYLDIGADNGGIVLNISESGLAVHAVTVLPPEPILDLRLQLPRSSKRLEARGKVAWMSGSKKEAGVEFLDLADEVRSEIKDWLAYENLEPVYVETAPPPESAAPRRGSRKDKWTSLVSELSSAPAGLEHLPAKEDVPQPLLNVEEVAPSGDAPATLELNQIPLPETQESALNLPERNLSIADALTADVKELAPESVQAAASGVTASTESASVDAIGEIRFRERGTELDLPSDTLLNNRSHSISIVPSRSKTDSAKSARSSPGAAPGDQSADDFLKKARALFGPKHVPPAEPEPTDVSAALEPAEELEPAIVSSNEAAIEPPPMSELAAAALSPTTPPVEETLRPVAAIPLRPTGSPSGPLKQTAAARTPARALNFGDFLGVVAMCVVLSAACLVIGIVVGRNAAMHSGQPAPAVANEVAVQPPATGSAESPSGKASGSASRAALGGGGLSQEQRTSRSQPAHRGSSAQRSANEGAAASPSDAAEDSENDLSATSVAQEEAVPPAAASVKPNGPAKASVSPPSSSALGAHVTISPPANATPRTQLPTDRLVAAYLIYRVEPIYPRAAAQLGVEGTVRIHLTVGRDGTVRNPRTVSGPPLLTAAALDAAQYWRYIPALRNGDPIETEEDIEIQFHLPH